MKSSVETGLDPALRGFFQRQSKAPCHEGQALLRNFAESRPGDFSFLQAEDLRRDSNSAFAGIPEWDVFAEHYASCRRCQASI